MRIALIHPNYHSGGAEIAGNWPPAWAANLSGWPSPVTAGEVLEQLTERVDLVIDGGACPGGVPSTVVDCTGADLRILREGAIARVQLETWLGKNL